jgi:hypothetical protein
MADPSFAPNVSRAVLIVNRGLENPLVDEFGASLWQDVSPIADPPAPAAPLETSTPSAHRIARASQGFALISSGYFH